MRQKEISAGELRPDTKGGATGHKRQLFVVVAACMTFFLGFESGGFQLALLRVAGEFALNQAMMGVLASLQFVAMVGMPLVFGRLADTVGKKRILAIFMPVFIVGCAAAAVSPTALAFVAGVIVIGAGFSVTECISTAAVSDACPDSSERTLNLVQSMFGLGAVAGPLVSDWLMRSAGVSWRIVFIIAGCGYLLLYPALLAVRIQPPARKPAESDGGNMLRVLKTPLLPALCIAIFLYVGLETGMAFFIDSFFELELSSELLGAYGISAFWLAMAVSRLLFSWLHTQAQRTVIVGFAITVAVIGVLTFLADTTLVLVLCAVAGFVLGPLWPTIAGMGTSACPRDTGVAASLLMAAGSVGGAVFPALMGVFSDQWGLRSSFAMLVLVAVAATSTMAFYIRKNAKRPAADCAE